MVRQKNRPQMKEQENSPEEKLDGGKQFIREFRGMIMRILNSMKTI